MEVDTDKDIASWSDEELARAKSEYEAKMAGLQSKLYSAQIIGGNTAAMEALKYQGRVAKINQETAKRNAAAVKGGEAADAQKMTARSIQHQGLRAAGRTPTMAPSTPNAGAPLAEASAGPLARPAPPSVSVADFFGRGADVGPAAGGGTFASLGEAPSQEGGGGQTLYTTPAPALLPNAPAPRARMPLGVTPPMQRYDRVAPEPRSPAQRDIAHSEYIVKLGMAGLMAPPHNLTAEQAQKQLAVAMQHLEGVKAMEGAVAPPIPGVGQGVGQAVDEFGNPLPTEADLAAATPRVGIPGTYRGATTMEQTKAGQGQFLGAYQNEAPGISHGGMIPAAPAVPARGPFVEGGPAEAVPARPAQFIAPTGSEAGPGSYATYQGTRFIQDEKGVWRAKGSAKWQATVKKFQAEKAATVAAEAQKKLDEGAAMPDYAKAQLKAIDASLPVVAKRLKLGPVEKEAYRQQKHAEVIGKVSHEMVVEGEQWNERADKVVQRQKDTIDKTAVSIMAANERKLANKDPVIQMTADPNMTWDNALAEAKKRIGKPQLPAKSKRLQAWEKVFGAVTTDFTEPEPPAAAPGPTLGERIGGWFKGTPVESAPAAAGAAAPAPAPPAAVAPQQAPPPASVPYQAAGTAPGVNPLMRAEPTVTLKNGEAVPQAKVDQARQVAAGGGPKAAAAQAWLAKYAD